jgi:hypothetical protein
MLYDTATRFNIISGSRNFLLAEALIEGSWFISQSQVNFPSKSYNPHTKTKVMQQRKRPWVYPNNQQIIRNGSFPPTTPPSPFLPPLLALLEGAFTPAILRWTKNAAFALNSQLSTFASDPQTKIVPSVEALPTFGD